MRYALDRLTRDSILRVVVYLTVEEGKHYEESGRPKGHIFAHAMRIARWLDTLDAPRPFLERLEEHKRERAEFM